MRWKTRKLATGDHVEIFNANGSNGTGKVIVASDNQVAISPDDDNPIFKQMVILPKSISRFYEKARYHFQDLAESTPKPNCIYAWGGYYRKNHQEEFTFQLAKHSNPITIYVYRDFDELKRSESLFEHHSFPYMIDTITWKATALADGCDVNFNGGDAVVSLSDQAQLKQQGIV